MKTHRFPKFLEYFSPLIAFAAAIAAVVGVPKWSDQATGLAKVTQLGWLVLVIGLVAMTISLLITHRNHQEKSDQRKTRERIYATARVQLLRAVRHTVHPMGHDQIWTTHAGGRPTSPIDFLDPERREALAELNLNAVSPYRAGNFEDIKWHVMFERAATEGTRDIVTSLQIFATYLPADAIEAATALLNSRFMQWRLLHMHDLVDANTHGNKDRRVPFFFVKNDEMHNEEYEEFWTLLASALVLFGAEKLSDGRPKLQNF
jgi:hypothetical protein